MCLPSLCVVFDCFHNDIISGKRARPEDVVNDAQATKASIVPTAFPEINQVLQTLVDGADANAEQYLEQLIASRDRQQLQAVLIALTSSTTTKGKAQAYSKLQVEYTNVEQQLADLER